MHPLVYIHSSTGHVLIKRLNTDYLQTTLRRGGQFELDRRTSTTNGSPVARIHLKCIGVCILFAERGNC